MEEFEMRFYFKKNDLGNEAEAKHIETLLNGIFETQVRIRLQEESELVRLQLFSAVCGLYICDACFEYDEVQTIGELCVLLTECANKANQ